MILSFFLKKITNSTINIDSCLITITISSDMQTYCVFCLGNRVNRILEEEDDLPQFSQGTFEFKS